MQVPGEFLFIGRANYARNVFCADSTPKTRKCRDFRHFSPGDDPDFQDVVREAPQGPLAVDFFYPAK